MRTLVLPYCFRYSMAPDEGGFDDWANAVCRCGNGVSGRAVDGDAIALVKDDVADPGGAAFVRRVADVKAYDRLYQRLIAKVSLTDVSASFVMEEIKETTVVPVEVR